MARKSKTGARSAWALLARITIALVLSGVAGQHRPAAAQTEGPQKNDSTPLVIQGRIIAIQGNLLTLKTPDVYPGGKGLRPQWVMSGPRFKIDVSHAKVFLADGRRIDKRPLAVGDRVLVVLKIPKEESSGPSALEQIYSASVVERLVVADTVTLEGSF
jgi:hypothetical protein